MALSPTFDSTQFMRKVPPPPHPGQLWYFDASQEFWHVIGMSGADSPIPYLTIAVYPESQQGGVPNEVKSLRLDEFYKLLHTGASLLGPRGVAWPPPDNRSVGF